MQLLGDGTFQSTFFAEKLLHFFLAKPIPNTIRLCMNQLTVKWINTTRRKNALYKWDVASLRAKVDKYNYDCSKSLGEKVIVIQLTALLLQVAILNRCQNFKSSITENLLTQDEINMFKEINRYKTSEEITLKYSQKHVKILEHSFNIFANIKEKMYKLNPLIFISLPEFSFGC